MNYILVNKARPLVCRQCLAVLNGQCYNYNHYETLRISKDASQDEIKSAYFTLSKQYHPDVQKDDGKVKEFVKINEAYSVLSSNGSKKRYDQHLEMKSGSSTDWYRQDLRNARKREWAEFHRRQSYSDYHGNRHYDDEYEDTGYSNEKLEKQLVRRLAIRSTLITVIILFALYCDVFAQQVANLTGDSDGKSQRSLDLNTKHSNHTPIFKERNNNREED